jgi:hypothetical protein|tara:strand:- start:1780 stop:1932 length:153 start_codon:yes stop_codon:yes gene_type:complete
MGVKFLRKDKIKTSNLAIFSIWQESNATFGITETDLQGKIENIIITFNFY